VGEQNSAYDLSRNSAVTPWPRAKKAEMMSKRSIIGILIILSTIIYPFTLAQGAEALIEDLRIVKERGNISISFSVTNCFNKKMEEAITSGIPTTFNFFVKLYKKRSPLWGKKIVAHRFRHTLTYDTLKDTFRIWLEEKGEEIQVHDLDEAKQNMRRVEAFVVVKERELRRGNYKFAIKAELDPVKLPLSLEGILFFVSLWDFETDWYVRTMRLEP
jgi:hypothetical protein